MTNWERTRWVALRERSELPPATVGSPTRAGDILARQKVTGPQLEYLLTLKRALSGESGAVRAGKAAAVVGPESSEYLKTIACGLNPGGNHWASVSSDLTADGASPPATVNHDGGQEPPAENGGPGTRNGG